MTQNTQFLRSGNLFSMIVQTNLSSAELETIPAIQQSQTATATTTTATEPASIDKITNNTDIELSFSELTAASLDNQRIKVVKAKKIVSNQFNTISINQNNSKAYIIDQFSNKSFIYTDANANELYRTITKSNTVQPFTFLSSNPQVQFYAGTPGADQTSIQTFTFKENKKKLQMLLINKQDISMWKGQPNMQLNQQKIWQVFNIPENIRNFRRIVKLMATILAREVGYFGSRYNTNKAYTQLEYSAVCWAIINMARKSGFNSGGDIIKLFDTEYTLNVKDDKGNPLEQSSPKKLIKTLQPGETETAMIARENDNILNHPTRTYKNNTQNLELYVMAFFNGLINEEFPGGSNWSHVRTDNNINPSQDFEITPFRIHPPTNYNGLIYPRYVDDGNGASTYGNDASNEKFSNGPVYTVAGGNPLVLISIN